MVAFVCRFGDGRACPYQGAILTLFSENSVFFRGEFLGVGGRHAAPSRASIVEPPPGAAWRLLQNGRVPAVTSVEKQKHSVYSVECSFWSGQRPPLPGLAPGRSFAENGVQFQLV